MYRLTYVEYWPGSWTARSMMPATDYYRVEHEHTKTLIIKDAVNEADAAAKANKFIEDSGPANAKAFGGQPWPHEAVELVKVIELKPQAKKVPA